MENHMEKKQESSSSKMPGKSEPQGKEHDHLLTTEQATESMELGPKPAPINVKTPSEVPGRSKPRGKEDGNPRTPEQLTASTRSRPISPPKSARKSTTKPAPNSAPANAKTTAYVHGSPASTTEHTGDAKASSFALDTKASKAKQTDKAELGPSRPPNTRTISNISLTEPPSPMTAGSSNTNRFPSDFTRLQKGKGKQPAFPVSNTGMRNGSSQNARPGQHHERQESRGSLKGKEVSLEGGINPEIPETEGVEPDMQEGETEEELALKREIAELEGLEVEGKLKNLAAGEAQRDPTQIEQDTPESKVQFEQKQQVNELRQRNQSLEQAIVKLQQRNRNLEDDLADAENSATDALAGQEYAIEREEAAVQKARACDEDVKMLSKEVKARTKELDEVKEVNRTSNEELTRLRESVEYLANAVKQTNTVGATKTKTLRELRWKPKSSPEVRDLHLHVAQFIVLMEDKLHDTKKELATANKQLQAARQAPQDPNLLLKLEDLEESEKHCRRLMQEEQKKREQAERALKDFQKIAGSMYRPDLEEQNRELQADLNTARDNYAKLCETTQTLRKRAQRWEGEFKTIKSRAEKESEGFALAYEQQQQDMLECMKEYHDKLNDPAYFDIKPLHEKVRALERELQVTTEEFDAVKVEKARMEEDVVPGIKAQIKEYEAEIEGLRDAWARDGVLREAYAFEVNKASKQQAKSDDAAGEDTARNATVSEISAVVSKKLQHVPRCLHPAETARREAQLKLLREKQTKQKISRDSLGTVMTRVHRWQMEDDLWEKRGWSCWLGKNSWDIWDGAGWVADVDLDMETRTLVAELEEQGFLLG